MKEEENNADEKEISSDVEKNRAPTQGKEKPFSSESNIHFFQDVMIDAAVKTSMSEKVDSIADSSASADSSACIIQYDNNCDT